MRNLNYKQSYFIILKRDPGSYCQWGHCYLGPEWGELNRYTNLLKLSLHIPPTISEDFSIYSYAAPSQHRPTGLVVVATRDLSNTDQFVRHPRPNSMAIKTCTVGKKSIVNEFIICQGMGTSPNNILGYYLYNFLSNRCQQKYLTKQLLEVARAS